MQLRSSGPPFGSKIRRFPRRGGAYPRGGENGIHEDGYKRKNVPVQTGGYRGRRGSDRSGVSAEIYRWNDFTVRRGGLGTPRCADRQREGQDDFPPGKRGSAERLVANRDEYCRVEIFPRHANN